MDNKEVEDYLFSLRNRGSKFGIERMELFIEALGNPQKKLACIHVAGTNGKGSTCAMLESIFRHAGYKTGLFTSPHLVQLGERVQCNRQLITQAQIAGYVKTMRPVAERLAQKDAMMHPTFFEFMTAMAFMHFAQEEVDIAIIETGLGGRLDSTNVITPLASVITSISLDHTEILGDTLEKIAAEKAGIIKQGVPVIIGQLPAAAQNVIQTVAEKSNAPLLEISEGLPAGSTNLKGHFQQINAAVATATAQALTKAFPKLSNAIAPALLKVDWQGRWQEVSLSDDRTLILDATHNPEGTAMLEENIKQWIATTGQQPIVLLGVLGEERAEAILKVLLPHAKAFVLFEPQQPRACTVDTLRAMIPSHFSGTVSAADVESVFDINGTLKIGEPSDKILATGSIYFIGELSQKLFHPSKRNEAFLQDKL